MFSINYLITDCEKDRLSRVQPHSPDTERIDVGGQIHLLFNSTEVGFIHNEVDFDLEPLTEWFEMLSQVMLQLINSEYVTMWVPESADVWLEFFAVHKHITIRLVLVDKDMSVDRLVKKTPNIIKKTFWSEHILKMDFYNTVLTATKRYIEELVSINELLMECKDISDLVYAYQEAKEKYYDS